MKRLFRILPVLALALAVAGCGSFGEKFGKSVFDGGLSVTATVQNPVTREQQAGVELSASIARTAILAYMRLPRCPAGIQRVTCSSWPVVVKLKDANRVANKQLLNMRAFMDTNQQVSAVAAFNAAVAALRDLRATAFVNGIEIQAQ